MRHALHASLVSALAACGPTGELAEATAGPGSSGTPGDASTTTGDTPATATAPTTTGTTVDVTTDAATTAGTTTTGTTVDVTTDATTTSGTSGGASTDVSSSSTGAPLDPCEELAIADPVLLAALRDKLQISKGPIPGEAALKVTFLDLVSTPIMTLAGIECLKNLEVLEISGPVSDLGPLAGLTKLGALALHGSQVTDLGPLVDLPIFNLTMKTSPLSDLGPLAEMSMLAFLVIDGSQIKDVTPLASSALLTTVSLQINMITTLAPLEQAPWVLNHCANLFVSGNPLDVATLATSLPIMCDLDMTISWDQGECAPDGLRCGFSDP